MILSKISVSIYPASSYGNLHQIVLRAERYGKEYRRTYLLEEDHLRSLFDRIFDGLKEQLREDIEGKK